MAKFNPTNPESLIYQNELLKLTVLGGIKLEGLDRMRATLKIELKKSSVPPVRHNLDLYNDTQQEKLIRKAAERLEIGTTILSGSIAELTEQLEAYRLQQLKDKEPEMPQKPTLSAKERKEAEEFLAAPGLMERTNEMIGKSGIIGEETNRLIMYLIFTSRKREQPLHIVSLGSSGTGKTHLQEKTGELIPEEDKIEITTLSENAFYYFGQRELKNKLILIEDLDGAENVLYPLRELQSKKRISKSIAHKNTKGETRTIHLVVEGPVSVAGCTTREYIYEDNANRSFLIYLDESPEQDKKIMEYQRKLSAGKINQQEEYEIKTLIRNTQRILEPVKVINPYAELLNIPEEVLKPRRTNNHYLQFIEAVTFYHQFQREKQVDKETGEIYIATTLEDIAEANQLIKEILLRKSDDLSGACRNYLENIKNYLEHEGKKEFTNREIRKALKINASNQKRYNLALVNNYYIKKVKGKTGTAYRYEIVSYKEFKELREHVTNVLDENLRKLKDITDSKGSKQPALSQLVLSKAEVKGFTGLLPVQKASEPVKPKKDNKINIRFTPSGKKVSQEKKNNRKISGFTPEDGRKYTYQKLMEANKEKPGKIFTVKEASQLTGKSRRTENKYMKDLAEEGLLERIWEIRKYNYKVKQT